ncbi:MAG: thioesterase [Fluviicola sp.]|nr:MAG: thioesterase [Fluviicola sp.]
MTKISDFLFKGSTQLRVRYGETDQMGYCYYGNYAQYFEVGRVEALRSIGVSYKNLESQGVMLPVSEYSVKYFLPALYDDELTITTYVTKLEGARLYFDYEIHNESDKLLAKANTTLVFVKKSNMRPTSPPDSFKELLSKL